MWLEALRPLVSGSVSRIASCPLEPGATASGAARHFTRQVLSSWGLRVLAEDAVLIVSELVTNALRYGTHDVESAVGGSPARDRLVHDPAELILLRRPSEMVCAVTDPGAEPPVLAPSDPLGEAGRGLQIIEAVAAAWGCTRLNAHKKAVWATLSVPGTDEAPGI
jgi:hypothetical protein